MAYGKKTGKSIEYQGESFTKSLTKEDGTAWEDNEIALFVLIDNKGLEVTTGSLVRSIDLLSLTFLLGKTQTTSLFGIYRLLVYLSDSVITEMNYVIAEYRLDYRKITSRND